MSIIKATEFLTALGLEVTTAQIDRPDRLGLNVTDASFWSMLNKADAGHTIKIEDVALYRCSRQTDSGRQHYVYRVEQLVPGKRVVLGTMEIYVRPVSKQALVLLEPLK
jgi:hypothetical protein